MPVYKLHYFNVRGRAELARLILAHAAINYEDIRHTLEEWPALKAKFPFGQLPVLEVDGRMLAQSHTIGRFLARKYGLAGKDDWDQAMADMYADSIMDLTEKAKVFYEQAEEKRKEAIDILINQHMKPLLGVAEKQLNANGSGYLVGNSLTWADLAFYYAFETAADELDLPSLYDDFPLVKELLFTTIPSIPSIKKWLETRPKTDV